MDLQQCKRKQRYSQKINLNLHACYIVLAEQLSNLGYP
jgi:hypothetical protein